MPTARRGDTYRTAPCRRPLPPDRPASIGPRRPCRGPARLARRPGPPRPDAGPPQCGIPPRPAARASGRPDRPRRHRRLALSVRGRAMRAARGAAFSPVDSFETRHRSGTRAAGTRFHTAGERYSPASCRLCAMARDGRDGQAKMRWVAEAEPPSLEQISRHPLSGRCPEYREPAEEARHAASVFREGRAPAARVACPRTERARRRRRLAGEGDASARPDRGGLKKAECLAP